MFACRALHERDESGAPFPRVKKVAANLQQIADRARLSMAWPLRLNY